MTYLFAATIENAGTFVGEGYEWVLEETGNFWAMRRSSESRFETIGSDWQ